MRNLTLLVALMAAVILVAALTIDFAEFVLPVIGAAAVLLFTLALELNPSEEVQRAERFDEIDRHRW